MISVGYMDPGNWATDIEGGSKYGYSLIWVLVMSNLIALLLQSHCVRLGVVAGRDLAQASKDHYSKFVNYFLYVLAEIAIAACDLAEVVGMAIGIHLLFPSISILMGVCITVLDSFVLLFLLNAGIKKLEAFIISLVAIIGVSFFIQLMIAEPDVVEISKGLIPGFTNENALYIAIGIIGATVMPHNLYLHSSLVQTRQFERSPKEIRKAIRFNIIDSAVALNLALFVNAAILIIAATTFFNTGVEVKEIQDAHRMMAPMLGSTLAPLLFAVALIAAGQSSTITGTLAGQVIMEGYLNLRLQPWIRRLLTRLIAIVPAFLTIYFFGEEKTGDLLVASQVILSLQLGFAIIPLIHFVSNKKRMGEFVIPMWQKIASWISVTVIVFLNCQMLVNKVTDWLASSDYPVLLWVTVIPFMILCLGILLFIVFEPLFKKAKHEVSTQFHGELQKITFEKQRPYSSIAVTVDFSTSDNKAINKALQLGGKEAHYILIHILESTNAVMYGEDTNDYERSEDSKNLLAYKDQLSEQGYKCEFKLGFGNPKSVIPTLVTNCDLLVMGTHGHTRFKDLLFGTTVEGVRHKISIPLVLV
ncbi:MAG: iron/manganese transporter [Bacteroidota bacterium]|jgi:manganese transport protein|nr:iron/manganese transporter [Bacteroidota bacterium]